MVVRYYVVEGGIRVYYEPELDGGGTTFGQMYVPILRRLGLGGSCYEPFSGPAFIGFSLLGAGVCDELVVSDVNPKAIDYVKLTVKLNGLDDRVRYYTSSLLEDIPRDLKFDLVIANPPHFKDRSFCRKYGCSDIAILKTLDRGFKMHRDFYHGIAGYLKPNGNVVLVENSEGSSPEDFIPMITESGLRYKGTIKPSSEDAVYALKVLVKNWAIEYTDDVSNGGFYRLIKRLVFIRSPNTILKHAPIPLIRRFVREMQKFYFIWSGV
jgi:Methylase of polypeptide chain release factors